METKDDLIERQRKMIELLTMQVQILERLDKNNNIIIGIYKKRAEAYEKIIMGKTDEKVNEPRSVTH